jgi:two-component system cell cycle sensor histidine kinase/response regulator CckA
LFDKGDEMAKVPGISAGFTEIPEQTEEQHPITHHDVADMPAEGLRQLLHELQIRQTKLEVQNEKLRRARAEGYNFSPAGQLTLDNLGKIVEANLRAATLVGIDRDKLIGQPFIRFVAQDSQDIFHWHCQKVLKTGVCQSCEMQLQKKSGAPHWVHLESLAVDSESGPVTHWQTALLDISEQKRTEGALRLAKFSMERAADAIYWVDQQARILDVNEAASLMLGYSKDELCAMTVHDLNPDFQKDKWPEFWAETQRCGTLVLETVHRAKNGRLIPIEVSVNYLFYEGKEYHCAFVRDITERRQAEEALEANERLLNNILENIPSFVFATDRQHRYILLSDDLAKFYGKRKEEILGKTHHSVFPENVADAIQETNEQIMTSGIAQQLEEVVESPVGGIPRILSTNKSPLRDEKGQIYGISGIATDITEHKRLEAQFRQAQKMDAVGRLAGGVAHDFNNLLTIINGYSAMLIERLAQEDPKREMAVETLKAGERASELTKQLLAFSRKQVLMPQPLNFNDSLRLISSMLNRLLGEQITLTMDLAPDLWLINGDKGQLNQVTMNLAINARDAMPNGGNLTITTRNLSVTPEWLDHFQMMPQGDYVHVSVHDTGHGMSPETLAHLFEPFFTTKEVGQGTGLGLATVYGIVKQSQGYVFTDSALDQGTTFHLYYPRVIAAAAVAPTLPIGHKKGSEHLLIVEDQDSVRALILQALKQDGYRVIEAASGEDALRKVSSLSEPIQALITDVIMPHMSGLVLAERLRVICPNIRVLFMSGYVDPSQSAFLDESTAAFIQKPFLPDDLARHLRNLLDKSIVPER